MSSKYRYAKYPSAKVYDKKGNQIKHLLWGDWVSLEGPADKGKVPVHVRGVNGFMCESDLVTERVLEIVFVDVGQGDGCLVVTPDDEKIIIDAGEADNMYRFLAWRFNFLGGVRTFDAAIITHPDKDHYNGFKQLFKDSKVRFKRVYHNGIMEQYPKKKPLGPDAWSGETKYITELMHTRADLGAFLADTSRYGKKLYANLLKDALSSMTSAANNVRMLAASSDPNKAAYVEGFGASKPVRLRILGPVLEPDAGGAARLRWFRDHPTGGSLNPGKTKNGHSVILKLEYGDVSILLGGDLNSSAEAFLLEHYTKQPWPPEDSNAEQVLIGAARTTFQADVVKCCHHGSADFTDAFLQAVNPAATVISSGDEESHAHPRSDTLGAVGLHGRGWRPLVFSTELCRSTREDEGDTRTEIGKLIEKIAATTDESKRKDLIKKRDDLLDELAKRNVTVYGAINLRTDGDRVVLAYMLEKPREGKSNDKKTLTRWDIYRIERVGNGPLVYVSD